MKISVVGTGYVGLVTGTCLAEAGNQVTCIDIDENKVKMMQAGSVPIYEPGLEALFERNIGEDRLRFTTNLEEGIEGAQVIFLALPTPASDDGAANLSFIHAVADELGPLLKNYVVIVDKSTVPVGTAEEVSLRISKNASVEFDVASNPEFLREGFAIADFMSPDRIVIGTNSQRAEETLRELYVPFVNKPSDLITMDIRSAELTKYAANAFLVTKISFINEIANLAERVGANVDAVRLGIGSDERIGSRFLYPGLGYGGSCFPKDVMALNKLAIDNDYDFKILDSVTKINRLQKQNFIEKIRRYFDGDLKGKKIALWGLAFKPDTDDMREAPSVDIIKALIKDGAEVVAYDPEAMPNARKILGELEMLHFVDHQYDALNGADALVIATEWEQFRSPDLDRMKNQLAQPIIFDGRNLYLPIKMSEAGFFYSSVGRQDVDGQSKR